MANGRVIFPDPITVDSTHSPSTKLFINADVRWHGTLVAGGCDEGCAAYLQVIAPAIAAEIWVHFNMVVALRSGSCAGYRWHCLTLRWVTNSVNR